MLSGAFADFVGEVEKMVADDCVRLFELMGQRRGSMCRGAMWKGSEVKWVTKKHFKKLNRVSAYWRYWSWICWPSACKRFY